MIDPAYITDFNRSPWELEEFAIFTIAVAGKTAKTIAPRIERLLTPALVYNYSPIKYLGEMGHAKLSQTLKKAGIGCHTGKATGIIGLYEAKLDLANCTIAELETIKWVSLKTSRFFVMHSRPDARIAALDTHILKGLATWYTDVPTSTPQSNKKYLEWEDKFLHIADFFDMSPAKLDLEWWQHYSGNKA